MLVIGGTATSRRRAVASQVRRCSVWPMQRCRAFPRDRSSLKRLFRKLKGEVIHLGLGRETFRPMPALCATSGPHSQRPSSGLLEDR